MGRPRQTPATFLASHLLLVEAAVLVPLTGVVVQLAGTLSDFNSCMGDCGPPQPSTKVSSMVLAGALGAFVVALHVVAAVGLRRGWRRARALGMLIGLAWMAIGVATGPLVVVFFVVGLVTIVACARVPDPT